MVRGGREKRGVGGGHHLHDGGPHGESAVTELYCIAVQ